MSACWSPDAPWPPVKSGPFVPVPIPITPPIELSERHLEVMRFRLRLLRHRGVPEDRAERIADLLAYRDRQGDDRQMCLECCEWQHGGTCASVMDRRMRPTGVQKGFEYHFRPLPDILQRCPSFNWERP